ncbi:hypothetical protein [Amaricoccus solimangrovi]|uniref:Uncharacterized protein n=1 Tax=Amaricoccus solimangrovi TaxID=2589815 RepID=A0A501WE53_9RHOB|nr:hypothetical protein [Amaricoccus solimangrovi]TPE46765.1 hypothetical protein FJM51_21320 [Amaricoccus solimangrovi]
MYVRGGLNPRRLPRGSWRLFLVAIVLAADAPQLFLATSGRGDSPGFFAALGGQVITGPTLTNVNDFRGILVLP